MGVTYLRHDPPERVSRQWFVLLHDIRHRDRVPFHVNEGHRTMARQAELYRLYLEGRGALAAVPSDDAPHIRTGRPDHAVDFNNAAGVRRAAARRGVTLSFTVPGESWHLEADRGELARYYEANKARVLGIGCRTLRKGVAYGVDVKAVQRELKVCGFLGASRPVTGNYGLATRLAVKRFKKSHGLPASTVMGPRAREALARAAKRRRG